MRSALTIILLATSALAWSDQRPPAVTNSLGMKLVRVPAGSFWRGSAEDESGHRPNEGPRRLVTISRDFYLAATETTVADFAVFTDETGYLTEAERDLGGGFGIDFRSGRVVQMPGITWRNPGFPGFRPTGRHPVLLVSW